MNIKHTIHYYNEVKLLYVLYFVLTIIHIIEYQHIGENTKMGINPDTPPILDYAKLQSGIVQSKFYNWNY